MPLRRFVFVSVLLLSAIAGAGCNSESQPTSLHELTIGVVSYDEGGRSLERYGRLQEYLSEQTKAIVEIEPAYNELQAIEQIHRKKWEIVFAPPGLAAIAIDQDLYLPMFTLEEVDNERRALLVVKEDSPVQTLLDLNSKIVAFGEPGSAAGYYLPLYDLYGLTLAEAQFAPTPKTALQWLNENKIDACALSVEDFERHKSDFPSARYRILHTSRWIPPGMVLLGPTVERNLQEQIEQAMRTAPPDITADTGYVPTAALPDYKLFTELVNKVLPLREQVKRKPAVLLYEEPANESS